MPYDLSRPRKDWSRISTQEVTTYDYERVYPLPNGDAYKAINGAVARAIWKLHGVHNPVRDSVDGATKYTIYLECGIIFQLFVMYVNEHFASISVNVINQPSKASPEGKYAIRELARFTVHCHDYVAQALRRAVDLGDTAPPPPIHNLDLLIVWRDTYQIKMHDADLAILGHVQEQSIRNARHRLQKKLDAYLGITRETRKNRTK